MLFRQLRRSFLPRFKPSLFTIRSPFSDQVGGIRGPRPNPRIRTFDPRNAPLKKSTASSPSTKLGATYAPAPALPEPPYDGRLAVRGQGVVELQAYPITDAKASLEFEFKNEEEKKSFIFRVYRSTVVLSSKDGEQETVLYRTGAPKIGIEWEKIGIESDSVHDKPLIDYYTYWLSLDTYNGVLRYGKGEIRLETVLATYDFLQDIEKYEWAKHITYGNASSRSAGVKQTHAWRDPVVTGTPLVVAASDALTMDMAAEYSAVTPAGLTEECQLLYGNISGLKFTLNDHDFPDFSDAIEWSINHPDGWCYKILKSKEGEFDEPEEKSSVQGKKSDSDLPAKKKSDPKESYLRITLGSNQGNSPGVPYVMEIWPGGHYSPVHNHGGANAVIRVLHGEITVRLFSFLRDKVVYFGHKTFEQGNVTYITPSLNQTHQLINEREKGPACITIQCYLYNKKDNSHYEYFDYINDKGDIRPFTPNSDMDFVSFKKLIKDEWRRMGKKKHDAEKEKHK